MSVVPAMADLDQEWTQNIQYTQRSPSLWSDQPEATWPLSFSQRNKAGDLPTPHVPPCRHVEGSGVPQIRVTALTMTETDTDLLSCRHSLKTVLGSVCIVICSHVYKIHTCPLKTLWKIFPNIRKRSFAWKVSGLEHICVRLHECTCAGVGVSHKNKHGRLREGGKCTATF